MNVNVTFNYKTPRIKIWFITIKEESGTVSQDIPVKDAQLNFNKPIDIPGPLDLVVGVKDGTLNFSAVYQGFPLYTFTEKLTEVVKGKSLKAPGFSIRGVSVSDITFSLK